MNLPNPNDIGSSITCFHICQILKNNSQDNVTLYLSLKVYPYHTFKKNADQFRREERFPLHLASYLRILNLKSLVILLRSQVSKQHKFSLERGREGLTFFIEFLRDSFFRKFEQWKFLGQMSSRLKKIFAIHLTDYVYDLAQNVRKKTQVQNSKENYRQNPQKKT